MEIRFKKLTEKAIAPIKQHVSDAGFDLTCVAVSTVRNERIENTILGGNI